MYVAKLETIFHVKDALIKMEKISAQSLARDMFEVKVDDERDEDQLPKAPEEGIWRAEDEAEETTKKRWRCVIQ